MENLNEKEPLHIVHLKDGSVTDPLTETEVQALDQDTIDAVQLVVARYRVHPFEVPGQATVYGAKDWHTGEVVPFADGTLTTPDKDAVEAHVAELNGGAA